MKQQSATKRQWISGVASVGVLVQHIAGVPMHRRPVPEVVVW